ncbi:putative cell wall biogenesis protein Ecm15 [Eremomyces bilateralis CBS 781.70]|uniref:Cell wall biogenesis protein Ecm15 n=1 Tax=Eremomyces bilateralis CBS 781.70 TaxID=1392243 RepID=A0A6G1GDL7_9PEZI|nr:putative cell wall biogenesis protein Ecm15 [Eremomyces bilateralis CBS 781.70]KAF1816187.1 putative cell wall biogenesis protein Ecm15 [Eremomyces bilateralis CBS 781.70]
MAESSPPNTPAHCTADFCLIPLGTPTASVSQEVTDVVRLIQRSGLSYSTHSAGTTLEGSWDDVMRVIGQAHQLLHENGVVRIQSDIRVGSRTDKTQTFAEKAEKVQQLLKEEERS